jgi:hypothetical protein
MPELDKLIVDAVSASVIGEPKTVRIRNGKSFLTKIPKFDPNRVPTVKQEDHLDKFAAGASYARAAMDNPELSKLYAEKADKEKSVFNIALRDYMKAPKVKKINVSAYTGNPGSIIQVKAKDDFGIKQVKVSIYNAAGDLVEEGQALIDPLDRFLWTYTATQVVAILAGSKIKAVAQDLPKNTGELEITL